MVQIKKIEDDLNKACIFRGYEDDMLTAELSVVILFEKDICVVTNMNFEKIKEENKVRAVFPDVVDATVRTALYYAYNREIHSAFFSVDDDTLNCLNDCGIVNFNNKFIPSLSIFFKSNKCGGEE